MLFLEYCAARTPPVVLAPDFKMTQGRVSGDAQVVSGTLSVLTLP